MVGESGSLEFRPSFCGPHDGRYVIDSKAGRSFGEAQLQNAQEFRKFVVAGYNSCGITKAQYSEYGARFQALDALAREINQLTGSPSLSAEQKNNLTALIVQFAELARKAGTETGQQPTNRVQQSTKGAGSPAVQGLQGDVTITVDQSSGEAKPKKAVEKKSDQKK